MTLHFVIDQFLYCDTMPLSNFYLILPTLLQRLSESPDKNSLPPQTKKHKGVIMKVVQFCWKFWIMLLVFLLINNDSCDVLFSFLCNWWLDIEIKKFSIMHTYNVNMCCWQYWVSIVSLPCDIFANGKQSCHVFMKLSVTQENKIICSHHLLRTIPFT